MELSSQDKLALTEWLDKLQKIQENIVDKSSAKLKPELDPIYQQVDKMKQALKKKNKHSK